MRLLQDTRTRQRISAALPALGLLAAVSTGCGSSGNSATPKPSPSPTFMNAADTCNHTLTPEGARALEDVSSEKEFTSKITKSLREIAKEMKAELPLEANKQGKEHVYCYISWKYNRFPIEVSFGLFTVNTGLDSKSNRWTTEYDLADGATSSDRLSSIYFHCPLKGEDPTQARKVHVGGYLSAQGMPYNNKNIRAANVRIIHALSVKLAAALGCLKSSDLPEKITSLKAYPVTE